MWWCTQTPNPKGNIEMAYYLYGCAAAKTAPPSRELHLGFQPKNPRPKLAPQRIPPCPFIFSLRLTNTVNFERRFRLFSVFGSNSNPSTGDSVTGASEVTKLGDTARGPPFLSILAGFLVFSLICWMLGSTIMWLIGVIVRLSPK